MRKEDIIASAAEELGVSSGEFGLWFEVLIGQCLESLKSSKLLEDKEAKILVEDGVAKLPEDYVDIYLKVFDDHCKRMCPGCKWRLENRIIVFCKKSAEMFNGKYIQIKYRGLKLDEEGELVIDNSWERMFVAYIGWKTCRRFFEKYPLSVREDYKKEFANQKLVCNY